MSAGDVECGVTGSANEVLGVTPCDEHPASVTIVKAASVADAWFLKLVIYAPTPMQKMQRSRSLLSKGLKGAVQLGNGQSFS